MSEVNGMKNVSYSLEQNDAIWYQHLLRAKSLIFFGNKLIVYVKQFYSARNKVESERNVKVSKLYVMLL